MLFGTNNTPSGPPTAVWMGVSTPYDDPVTTIERCAPSGVVTGPGPIPAGDGTTGKGVALGTQRGACLPLCTPCPTLRRWITPKGDFALPLDTHRPGSGEPSSSPPGPDPMTNPARVRCAPPFRRWITTGFQPGPGAVGKRRGSAGE